VANLKKDTSINSSAIETFIKKGPEIKLAFEASSKTGLQQGSISSGFGLRLRIPYADAGIESLKLNGHALSRSNSDGYEIWKGDGFLQVQIHVPPSKVTKMDLAVVTCEYSTKTKRTYGWTPPREVLDKLK
jgi:hypothetical protein